MNIYDLREKIDYIDNEIISLIRDRNEIIEKIIDYKKINNLPIYDVKREKEKLSKLEKPYENLIEFIMEDSKITQFNKIFNYSKIGKNEVDEINLIVKKENLIVFLIDIILFELNIDYIKILSDTEHYHILLKSKDKKNLKKFLHFIEIRYIN